MKTQLLEDIGQSTAVPLARPNIVANSQANQQVQSLAPAGSVQPAEARPKPGVWRQKPAPEPLISPEQGSDQQAATLGLDEVFEELAALEAQLVHPGQQHELPAQPAEPSHRPAIAQAEATIPRHPPHAGTVPQDPLFDFTVPMPAEQAADPFTPAATGLTRSSKRYLLWGACVVSGLLLILGGRWFYQERNDAAALALIANETTAKPQADSAVQRAVAAREAAPGPGAGSHVTPAVPEPRPVSGLPPLVMLEPEAPAVSKPAPTPPPVTRPAERQAAPKPQTRTAHKPPEAARPATEKAQREPVRQVARASTVETKKPARREATMTATLQACRENGYNAAQCVKRACEVTQYGFVCRGR